MILTDSLIIYGYCAHRGVKCLVFRGLEIDLDIRTWISNDIFMKGWDVIDIRSLT